MYVSNLLNSKQYQQSAGILNKLITADPNSSYTYYLLAYAQSAMSDNMSSEKNLKKAIEIYQGYKEAVVVLGNMYKTQNKLSEARNVYNAYLKINPSDSTVLSFLNSLPESNDTK
jgi:Tfp pilus assembly protein PilF